MVIWIFSTPCNLNFCLVSDDMLIVEAQWILAIVCEGENGSEAKICDYKQMNYELSECADK